MWSLTARRERRTSGPENFQSSAKKDFCNTIGGKADTAPRVIAATNVGSMFA